MSKLGKSHLNDLYKAPLPIHNVVPLPPPTLNPLSVLFYLYKFFFDRVPTQTRYKGTLNEETRSVWIHDETSATALWTSGFFGKGQFSRSEPSWYIRTQRMLGLIGRDEKLTSEEVTARRRLARADMKTERARKEREALEATLRAEGRLTDENDASKTEMVTSQITRKNVDDAADEEDITDVVEPIPNIEHLQLTLYEALFLADALDAIDIYQPDSHTPMDRKCLLAHFTRLMSPSASEAVFRDSTFLVQYAVYHHYRSLGWTVKPGVKFGVDWLLYKRGPVFSHAEFSIIVIPSPRHEQGSEVSEETKEGRPWWWLHTLTRVNGQVKKTVILTYVEFVNGEVDVDDASLEDVMRCYNIREVSLRRWIPSRNRD